MISERDSSEKRQIFARPTQSAFLVIPRNLARTGINLSESASSAPFGSRESYTSRKSFLSVDSIAERKLNGREKTHSRCWESTVYR